MKKTRYISPSATLVHINLQGSVLGAYGETTNTSQEDDVVGAKQSGFDFEESEADEDAFMTSGKPTLWQ